jgi:hypothetical protein
LAIQRLGIRVTRTEIRNQGDPYMIRNQSDPAADVGNQSDPYIKRFGIRMTFAEIRNQGDP